MLIQHKQSSQIQTDWKGGHPYSDTYVSVRVEFTPFRLSISCHTQLLPQQKAAKIKNLFF